MSAQPDDAPRGFVPMREYLRLQDECDELREQLANMCPVQNDPRIARVCMGVGTSPQRARVLLVLWRASEPLQGFKLAPRVGAANPQTLARQIVTLRRELRAAGAPETVRAKRWHGYWLTDEGRAWLQERVPEAFEGRKP